VNIEELIDWMIVVGLEHLRDGHEDTAQAFATAAMMTWKTQEQGGDMDAVQQMIELPTMGADEDWKQRVVDGIERMGMGDQL
jgi:hypothetical protein